MFSIGDQVVHPMHGAGIIDDIVREKIAGISQEYYVFKMPMGGLVLKIPVANSQTIGIRSVITEEEAEGIFSSIPMLEIEGNANWNKRYQENLVRLKSGDLMEVARVIKSLMHREQQRGLSTGERKMLHNAKQIMISEMVLCKHVDYKVIETRLDELMLNTETVRG